MTDFSPYLGETGPGTNAGDSDAYSMGIELIATDQCWITHVHWWQAASGSAKSTATRTGAILRVLDGVNMSGTQTFGAVADGWNSLALSSPVELAPGTRYKAVVCHPAGGYSADSHYYDSGAGTPTQTFGPVDIVDQANANSGQNSFTAGGTLQFPNSQFNSTRYWVSFTVSDVEPSDAITGVLAASTPLPGVSGTATVVDTGVLAASTPLPVAALAGVAGGGSGSAVPGVAVPGDAIPGQIVTGALAASTPLPVASLAAEVEMDGTTHPLPWQAGRATRLGALHAGPVAYPSVTVAP